MAAPAVAGSNCTFSVTDWVGFKVTGKVAPDMVKPVPLSVAELMVTGAVPVEVNVTGSVVGVFTVTLPNAKLAGLMLSVGTCGIQPVQKVLETPPARRSGSPACQRSSPLTVAVNPALVALAGTTSPWHGTRPRAAASQAHSLTRRRPRSRAQRHRAASLPAPVSEALHAGQELNSVPATAVPVPLSPITAVPLVDELLWMVS